ncbi:hypothetical protein Zm00014a_005949 [Zea mays]|uniref:Uncharacterized protein n=1 Tax=Zea mays TaxID=4577 RepID=A0A317Y6K1_MAIZE|nr:hypothetical protein Zm00014a_005949 [Zea mays]
MRAVNMMKNNQLFQRLGLGQLKTMITTTSANNKQGSPQESGSLYDGENVEDSGEEDVGMEFQARKGVPTHISNDGEHMSTKVTRGNKRIMAPVQEQPVRVTRQRVAKSNKHYMGGSFVLLAKNNGKRGIQCDRCLFLVKC